MLEKKTKNMGSLNVLRAHKDYVATLFLSVFNCFQILPFYVFPTTHSSFCLPVSLWAPSLCPPPCFTAFSVSHTHPFPFSTVCSSSNIIWLPLSSFFPLFPALIPLHAVLSLWQREEPLSCIIWVQSPLVLYACSGYSAVYWIKNKQGGIHCSGRRDWAAAEIYNTPLLVKS